MDEFFDAFTLRHLDAFLDAQISGDEARAEVRTCMLNLAKEDPEYWSAQGWWNLFDRADCGRILARHA